MLINYYVFDRIEQDESTYWGYLGNDFCEVYPIPPEETDESLIEEGFAKCDAPGTETFCVEESNWQCLKPS